MKKAFVTIIVLSLFAIVSFAGHDNYPVGARQAGMGNASVMQSDMWSLWHNQAGLAFLDKTMVGVYYDNRFLVPEYGYKTFGVVVPTKRGVIGMSFSYFGYSLYNEKKIGLAYAKSFSDKFSIGIQLNYLNTFIGHDYGSKGTLAVEVGFMAQPIENVFIGAHVYNPTRSKLAIYEDERVPTIYRLGIGYKAGERAFIGVEIEKQLDYVPRFKAGVEYGLTENFFLRTGLSIKPLENSFGVGYKVKGLIIDLAFSTNRELGMTPHVSMIYTF